MIFIGDVHGNIATYKALLGDKPSMQLGDMGCGFSHIPEFPPQHRFLRGNHDSPDVARRKKNYAGDYGYDPAHKLFYLSGAYSIDWQWRKPGISWWEDEELSLPELNAALELYLATKPEIVASHECPEVASRYLLSVLLLGGFRPEKLIKTRTGQALQAMWEAHKPKYWVFGHYHIDKEFEMEGTRFVCLSELSMREIRE